MKKNINIALTWGYTWWHVFPLLSIYNYFKDKKNYNFIWIWESNSLEETIANKNNIKFCDIPAWKIRRYFDLRNFYEPLKNLTGIIFGIYYLIKNKIDIVFSKWWYVSIPLCIAAFILRKKIYIHESDSYSWIANKIVGLVATKIFYTFPNSKINGKKHVLTGQILNPELLDFINNIRVKENDILSVIVIWWSQWSSNIFKTLLKILPDIDNINFQVILWEKNLSYKADFAKFDNVITYDFVTQKILWKILHKADIAITRWWATTLWELNMFWIHSIIIPLRHSAWNHQMKNAMYFQKNFESDVLEENNHLDISLLQKLETYKELRKTWLNLDNFFIPLKIIKKEIK